MLYGYDPTDLSQSYPLRDDQSLQRHREEQSRAFWREQEMLRSRSIVVLPSPPGHPASRGERALALAAVAIIAAGWAYLLFS